MIYRLEKASAEGMKIIKKGDTSPRKFYNHEATARLAIGPNWKVRGAFDTGLTPEQETEFEELIGLDKGTLDKKNKEYWTPFGIMVQDGGILLDDSDPEDALKIAILKKREDMATSKHEARIKSGVKWLLYSEEGDAEVEVVKISDKALAFAKYSTMTIEDMNNYLRASNLNPDTMSEKIVRAKVGKSVDETPKKFLALANDKRQSDRIMINEMVAYEVLKMNKNSYINDEGMIMAHDMTSMLSWISDKQNVKALLGYKRMLEEAKNK